MLISKSCAFNRHEKNGTEIQKRSFFKRIHINLFPDSEIQIGFSISGQYGPKAVKYILNFLFQANIGQRQSNLYSIVYFSPV